MATAQENTRIVPMPYWLRIIGGCLLLGMVLSLMPNDNVAQKLFYVTVGMAFVGSGTHELLKIKKAPSLILNISTIVAWMNIILLVVALIADWSFRH